MDWKRYDPPREAAEILAASPELTIAGNIKELIDVACGGPASAGHEVAYEIKGRGQVVEAAVARVRNGVSVNYTDSYMRRRDPDCLIIADDQPTDKPTFRQRYGQDFAPLREQTFAWLKSQPLAIFGFMAGQPGMGLDSLVVAPANAGFFALALALLQGILPYDEVSPNFSPKSIIYVAPPFRHTHFGG